jgi:hypothetical protein
MALISCPECDSEVSDLALACPHCGCPLAEQPASSSGVFWGLFHFFITLPIAVSVVAGLFFACAFVCADSI